ncbi:MAG: porin [Campylobacterota bacterium]|nr:porin [Campylobacterota bacterium]
MYYLKNFIIFFSLVFLPLFAEELTKATSLLSAREEKVPDVPTFPLDYKGEALKCYPIRYNDKNFYERQVEYRCIRKDIKITETEMSDTLNDGEVTGRDETKRLQDEIKQKKNVGSIYTVNIPERNARSPWTARGIAKRQLRDGFFQNYLRWLLPAKFYASARPQYAGTNDGQDMKFRDGGSRGGFFYYYEFGNDYQLTFQYEAKINWSDMSSFINTSNNSDSTRRLQYISLAKGDISFLAGKYWSPYYDIAGITDRFMAYGAESSGTYNASGDGGASGTGRSNRALQLLIGGNDNFSARIQYQPAHHPNDGVNSDYSYGLAGNIIYKGWSNIETGASIAYGKFNEITSEMRELGIEGSDLSYIAGISYRWKDLSANGVLSYTRNHMSDDQGIYFNGVGAELYLRYDFGQSIRFALGGNWLKPRDSSYQGKYNIKKSILSLQYTFGRKTFDDLVYVEVSIPKGHLANGDAMDPSVAVGLRYLFNLW